MEDDGEAASDQEGGRARSDRRRAREARAAEGRAAEAVADAGEVGGVARTELAMLRGKVGGRMDSAVNVDGVAGADFSPIGTGDDLLFVRYSATGSLAGGQVFNGTSTDVFSLSLNSMNLAEDGAILAAGFFSATLFGGSPALGLDAFLAKLDPASGALLWARKHGGTGIDQLRGVAAAGCGDVFAVGAYAGPGVDFGGGPLPFSGSSSSISNGVLAKYRP